MKHLFLLTLLLTAALLSACGGTLSVAFDTTPMPERSPAEMVPQPAAPTNPVQIVSLEAKSPGVMAGLNVLSDSETIRRAMLESHTRWQTLWLDGEIIENMPGGETQRQRVQIWIDQPNARFRVLSGTWEGTPDTVQVSDGAVQAWINLSDASTQTQPISDEAHRFPWTAPVEVTDTITPHPLDLEIDTRFSELAFPAALAERGGMYAVEGVETVAGRPSIYAAWWLDQQMHERLWLDAETGVVLRSDSYGKDPTNGGPFSTVVVNDIRYDLPVAEKMFALELAERPQFALDSSGAVAAELESPSTGYKEGAGSLYFVVNRSPDTLQMARLPGNCITGPDVCPSPEVVEGFPNLNETIHPLVWSPDGTQAALATNGVLWAYSPKAGEWKTLAMFPILVGDPLWSPDGQRLVFTMQNDSGQDIYTVRPDGAELTNLTSEQMDGYDQLWLEGWTNDGRLLFSAINQNTARLYTLQPGQAAEPLGELELQGGLVDIDQSGRLMVTSEQVDGAAVVNLVVIENGAVKEAPRQLTRFGGAGIAQISAAPGNYSRVGDLWIVILVNSGGPSNTVSTLYAIRADGTDMRQIFQSTAITSFTFTGDGQSVIVEGTDNGRLTLVSLEGQSRVLEAADLRLDYQLAGASWRK